MVQLIPRYLPAGFTPTPPEVVRVPEPDGPTVTIWEQRFVYAAHDAARRATIYLRTISGAVDDATPRPGEVRVIGGREGSLDVSDRFMSYAFDVAETAGDAVAEVGAIGNRVTETQLTAVIGELVVSDGIANADSTDVIFSMLPPEKDGCGSDCPSSTNMKGTGVLTNDWSGDGANRVLSDGSHGNDVGVWQGVLWADAASSQRGLVTDCMVDGAFGSRTQEATHNWQSNWMDWGQADGVVGMKTWGRADDRLTGERGFVFFNGAVARLVLKRKSSAPYDYTWSWAGSGYRYTGYSGRDIKRPAHC